MIDIITYIGYGILILLAGLLLWVIVSNIMAQTHRERMDNAELSLDRLEVIHDMNMGDKYYSLAQREADHDMNMSNKYFDFMQQRAIAEDVKSSREQSFMHNMMLINQDFNHEMENKWFNLYRMQVMNNIQNDNKMTEAFVRAMQIFGVSVIANLIQNGLSQADVLSLINQGATVNDLKELIQLANEENGGNTEILKLAVDALKEANKPLTAQDLIEAVKALKQAGVPVESIPPTTSSTTQQK